VGVAVQRLARLAISTRHRHTEPWCCRSAGNHHCMASHRFRLFWNWKNRCGRPGRPRVS